MEKEQSKKKIIDASKYTIKFRVLYQGTSLIAVTLLVRALSEHEYGIYNLLYSVIGFMGIVASLGISNTLQRYIPEYYSNGEYKIANNLYKIAAFIRLLSNLLILGFLLVLWDLIAPFIKIAAYKQYFMLFPERLS